MKRLVSNNEFMEGVVYKTKNIVVQKIQSGKDRKRCYIIGNGHSLSIDDNNYVIKHDPLVYEFTTEIKKDYTVYAFYFTFECSGLDESSQEIAKFANDMQDNYDQIFFVGHSKCGLCLENASWYCKKEIVLITISTPHQGTIVADKEMAETILKNSLLIKIYNMIFSDYNVDKDIVPNSKYIQNMNHPVCKEHINIVSSLRGVRDCRNIIDIFLVFLDRIMKIGEMELFHFVRKNLV